MEYQNEQVHCIATIYLTSQKANTIESFFSLLCNNNNKIQLHKSSLIENGHVIEKYFPLIGKHSWVFVSMFAVAVSLFLINASLHRHNESVRQ